MIKKLTILLFILFSFGCFSGLKSHIIKARSYEAQLQLDFLYKLEASFFKKNQRYSTDLIEIGFEQPNTITNGGQAYYIYQITEATDSTFTAKATCIYNYDKDNAFDTWTIDQNKSLVNIIKE